MKLYTPEAPAPWIGTAEQKFREMGAADFPCPDNDVDPRLWMREFPLGTWALEHGIEPEAYTVEAAKHFTFLEEAGIALPSLEMQAVPWSFSRPSFEHALYVTAANVDNAYYPDFIRGADPEQQLRELVRSLHTYVDWVRNSSQKFALFDIFRTRQYLYGRLGMNAPKRIYLVDVEPALAATHHEGVRVQQWRDGLDDWERMRARYGDQ